VARGHPHHIGLPGVIEMFAKRVRRADRGDQAKEMIQHSDELAAQPSAITTT
jgi:hypothetical protein